MNHERVHYEWTKFGTFRTCPMCPSTPEKDSAECNLSRALDDGGRRPTPRSVPCPWTSEYYEQAAAYRSRERHGKPSARPGAYSRQSSAAALLSASNRRVEE